MLALWGAAPVLASPGPEWLLNKASIKSSVPVAISGSIALKETSFGAGENMACNFTAKAKVMGVNGTIESMSFECTSTKCATATGVAENLPWAIELYEGGVVETRMRFKGAGSGEPKWRLNCAGALKNFWLEEGGKTTMVVHNLAGSEGGVEAISDSQAHTFATLLGNEYGYIESAKVKFTSTEGALSVSPPMQWLVNGETLKEAAATTSKGTLKFSDSHGGIFDERVTLECGVTGKGAVDPAAADEVTQWTLAGCKTTAGICVSPGVSAQNLPWHSELAIVEGSARDKIVSSGKGAPKFTLDCEGANDECSGSTSTAVENVSGGVDAIFDSRSAKQNCSRGGSGQGSIEGTELIENPSSGTLTVP
ncbi:MAG TPA: hypothetical protein VG053_04090 [Solirubrobacteraceae bacterium]|nr:hypothetical protein [Solirubrobacteraceae bacterium]